MSKIGKLVGNIRKRIADAGIKRKAEEDAHSAFVEFVVWLKKNLSERHYIAFLRLRHKETGQTTYRPKDLTLLAGRFEMDAEDEKLIAEINRRVPKKMLKRLATARTALDRVTVVRVVK